MSRPDPHTRPAAGEAPFGVEEVFFSRTDPRGVIQAGNEVFRRVADFEWSELIGAPHKVVRHSDMPRGLFQLMWDRLKAEKTVAAYVKNKAQDGLHYWVFALVAPAEEGFLSVRIKPTSALFKKVTAVYEALHTREEEEELNPAASAEAFLAALEEHGYADYDAFMADAVSQELAARAAALGQPEDIRQKKLALLARDTADLAQESEGLTRAFEAIRAVPINLGITAAGLGDLGRPVAVIAENYGMMCREVFDKLNLLRNDGTGGFATISEAVRRAQVLGGTAEVQREAAAAFAAETEASPVDREDEIGRLHREIDAMHRSAHDGLHSLRSEVNALSETFRDLSRLLEGLDVTRILCRVESGRMPPSQNTTLAGIIDSIDKFHEGLSDRLVKLDRISKSMAEAAGTLEENRAVSAAA